MKKVLKFVIAVMMLGSLGIAVMSLVSMGDWNLSAFDIIKMGFTETQKAESFAEKMVLYSVKDYACPLAGLLVLVVFAAILTAAVPSRHAYIVSMAEQASVHIYVGALCMQMKRQSSLFEEILENTSVRDVIGNKVVEDILNNRLVKGLIGRAMENLGISGLEELGAIEIQMLPMLVWVALYAVILLLTVVGLCLREARPVPAGPADAMQENFRAREREYLDRIRELEAERAAASRQAGRPAISEAVENPAARRARDNSIAPVAAGIPADSDFTGGIIGESGLYMSKVYLMKDRTPVLFYKEGAMLIAREDMPAGAAAGTALAEIYYVAEYREYCVKPARKQCVFLESGQPLGAGREYYLPRGMKICLEDRNQTFTLA